MALDPGLTFRIAPRFHCRADWGQRLHVNGGITRRDGGIYPRDDWQPASAEDLLRLLPNDQAAGSAGGGTLDLLALPSHLRRAWWERAEQAEGSGAPSAGYQGFVADLLEFLRFKRLPVPDRCAADVVASRPGQASTRLDGAGRALAGFAFGRLAPGRAAPGSIVPIAVINLGDERTHVVVLNLGIATLRVRLGASEGSDARVLDTFLMRESGYPLIRVNLDPGEGLWFPSPPPAFDGWTIGKDDLDVMLVLQA